MISKKYLNAFVNADDEINLLQENEIVMSENMRFYDEKCFRIIGFEKYIITESGRVISFQKGRVKEIKPSVSKINGYAEVKLFNGTVNKTFKLHRLYASYFLPNPENKPYINHINGIKADNRIKNLEWCTHSENIIHAIRTGLLQYKSGADHYWFGKKRSIEDRIKIGEKSRGRLQSDETRRKRSATALEKGINKKKVICYNNGMVFNSVGDAANFFNVCYDTVHRQIKGSRTNKLNVHYLHVDN